jgi:capsular polysaccharide biosynthesis protein
MATEPRFSPEQPVHQFPAPKQEPVERAPVGPWAAVLRHPFLFALVFLLCAGAGVYLGLSREPIYTAETRLNVGNIDVTNQALPGYVSATQSLAGSYSRAIDSQGVITPLARRLDQPPDAVAAHVRASPIPSSSIIRVEATAASAAAAITLVNAASSSLQRYVQGLEASAETGAQSLARYRDAQISVSKAERTVRRLTKRYVAAPSASLRSQLQGAKADLSTAQLRVQALAARYQSEQQQAPVENFVRSLGAAATASSDRTAALELRAFSGAIAGLLLGAAIVLALTNRRRVRDG